VVIFQILSILAAFLVPGVAWAWCVNPAWAWPLRLAVGFTLGVLVVPLASFSAAWLLGQSVTPGLVLGCAALLTLPAGACAWRRARRARA
jgi:hypothetical protein